MKSTVYVIESGWILCGEETENTNENIMIKNASVVRRWDNGRGIGGLANPAYKGEYKLDFIGDVQINKNKLLFSIPCQW